MTRQIAVSITLQYVCSTVHSHWVKSNTHTKQETGFQFLYTYSQVFRRPSQLRWGASNSLILREEEGGRGAQLAFLEIEYDLFESF